MYKELVFSFIAMICTKRQDRWHNRLFVQSWYPNCNLCIQKVIPLMRCIYFEPGCRLIAMLLRMMLKRWQQHSLLQSYSDIATFYQISILSSLKYWHKVENDYINVHVKEICSPSSNYYTAESIWIRFCNRKRMRLRVQTPVNVFSDCSNDQQKSL